MPLTVPSDIEIATRVKPRPIVDVARDIGLSADDIEQYGNCSQSNGYLFQSQHDGQLDVHTCRWRRRHSHHHGDGE